MFIWADLFVIIHQGHERKEINLCLAAFIDPPLENCDHFPRGNLTRSFAQTVSRRSRLDILGSFSNEDGDGGDEAL